jgi:hypothetical protein
MRRNSQAEVADKSGPVPGPAEDVVLNESERQVADLKALGRPTELLGSSHRRARARSSSAADGPSSESPAVPPRRGRHPPGRSRSSDRAAGAGRPGRAFRAGSSHGPRRGLEGAEVVLETDHESDMLDRHRGRQIGEETLQHRLVDPDVLGLAGLHRPSAEEKSCRPHRPGPPLCRPRPKRLPSPSDQSPRRLWIATGP